MATERPKVLIIGGGFTGYHAARALRGADADVVLLDRSNNTVFSPLLYQCATGLLSQGQMSSPLRHLFRNDRNIRVEMGEAEDIDVQRQVVTVARFEGPTHEIEYDYLVIGAGMRQSYHGAEHIEQYATGMKTLDDALAIRRKIITSFEIAETLPAGERDPFLTFAVAGGGPTGVELAGQIRELADRVLAKEFRTIEPSDARVYVLHGGDRILNTFSEKLAAKAQRTLDKIGVETILGVHVTDVDDLSFEITAKGEGGASERIPANTVFWTAGVEAVPFAPKAAQALGIEPLRDGRIPVDASLRVAGHPQVFVGGDVMATEPRLPGVAETAMQSGRFIGKEIRRHIDGVRKRGVGPEPRTFKYLDLGTAAYISRRNAILETGPFRFSGTLGWLAWGAIHVFFLASFRNRAATLTTWFATLFGGARRERAIVYGDPETARQPYPPAE